MTNVINRERKILSHQRIWRTVQRELTRHCRNRGGFPKHRPFSVVPLSGCAHSRAHCPSSWCSHRLLWDPLLYHTGCLVAPLSATLVPGIWNNYRHHIGCLGAKESSVSRELAVKRSRYQRGISHLTSKDFVQALSWCDLVKKLHLKAATHFSSPCPALSQRLPTSRIF